MYPKQPPYISWLIFLSSLYDRIKCSVLRIVIALILCIFILPAPGFALEKVRLQLKYLHQFQFAGYYAALEQGYYTAAGLEVIIVEGQKGDEPLREVLSGGAHFGIGSSSLILEHSKKSPVVVLGVIFQHSPYTLLMPKLANIQSIHDIVGKKVMIADQADELIAYLNQESISLESLIIVPHSFNPRDLIEGKVEGFSAYSTNETDYLDQQGFDYHSFSPRSAGIDFYGDNLFTSEKEINTNPERVEAFRKASMLGWNYAFKNPDRTIELILKKYSTRNTAEHLYYEYQQMVSLVQPILVDIGYMNPGRWRHIADTYADLDMLTENYQFDGFIYDSKPPINMVWWYVSFITLLFMMLLISTVHYRNRAKERLIAKEQIEFKNILLSTQQEASIEGMLAIGDNDRIISANQRFIDLWQIDKVVIEKENDRDLLKIIAKKIIAPEIFLQRIQEILRQPTLTCTEEIDLLDGRVMERYTAPMTSESGQYLGRLWSFRDITTRKKADKVIWKQANLDSLTGLPNRYNFFNKLESAIDTAEANQAKLFLLFLDLDQFKEVNDTLGHHIGDNIIQETANRLLTCMSGTATVARLGGDEFTIILENLSSLSIVEEIANRILEQLSTPFPIDNELVYISTSIGITVYPDDGGDVNSLIKNADQAMYAAKDSGRNRFRYFTSNMYEKAITRQNLIKALRGALEQDEFQLHYQPIFCLKNTTMVKAEALIRWNNPDKGLLGPDEFIPLAEETVLINQIGNWVFQASMKKLKYWRSHYNKDLQVSINVSPVQFSESGGMSTWSDELKELGLPSDSLIIEITEGLLMGPSQEVSDKLLYLCRENIMVALDDFGTGYSSLAYLNRFDIDYLKIDKQFVWSLKAESRDYALCEAIVVMAHKLDIRVIAEGIETKEQLNLLNQMGCDFGQGYFLSKPLPEAEFERFLMDSSDIHLP